ISDIVSVTITRETPILTQVGFGTLMILGTNKVFNERIKFYSELEELTDDGFATTSQEYIAANSVFSQSPRPRSLAIGRRSTDTVVATVTDAVMGNDYTVTINGTDFTHTALLADTEALIAT